jgi:hypothetical protein
MKTTEENITSVLALCEQLSSLQRFPLGNSGWYGYARGVCRFAEDIEKVQSIIDWALDTYETLPTVADLRAHYESRWPIIKEPTNCD